MEATLHELVAFSKRMTDFPRGVLSELTSISTAMRSLRVEFLASEASLPNITKRVVEDVKLSCSVLQTICGSVTEIIERSKYPPNDTDSATKFLWDDYNAHMKSSHGLEFPLLLELCQDFEQILEDVVVR